MCKSRNQYSLVYLICNKHRPVTNRLTELPSMGYNAPILISNKQTRYDYQRF